MAISSELRGRIQEVAGQLRREFYGGRGAPISGEILFEELEKDACKLGDALACELMEQVLHSQAEDDHLETRCQRSVCGRDGKLDEVKPRIVQTRRGEVRWPEPRYFCKHSRKAFFPHAKDLGIEADANVSPGILKKMVYAGSHAASFRQASTTSRNWRKSRFRPAVFDEQPRKSGRSEWPNVPKSTSGRGVRFQNNNTNPLR